MSPRHNTLRLPQLLVKMVQPMTNILRYPYTLLQQITHVLDMFSLFLQEPRLDCVLEGVIAGFIRCFAEAKEVLEEFLLALEGVVHGNDGVDGVVWEVDVWGGDVAWLGAAAALDEVAFEPHAVGEAFCCCAFEEPVCGWVSGGWTVEDRWVDCLHGKTVQADVGSATVSA